MISGQLRAKKHKELIEALLEAQYEQVISFNSEFVFVFVLYRARKPAYPCSSTLHL